MRAPPGARGPIVHFLSPIVQVSRGILCDNLHVMKICSHMVCAARALTVRRGGTVFIFR